MFLFHVHVYVFYDFTFSHSFVWLLSLCKHVHLSCVFLNKLTYLFYLIGVPTGKLPQYLTVTLSHSQDREELEQRCFSKHQPHTGRRNWPWPSNSFERGTKHTFCVNLAQPVQWFPRYFIHKESHRECQKQNLMQFTVCGNYVFFTLTMHKRCLVAGLPWTIWDSLHRVSLMFLMHWCHCTSQKN